MQSIQIEFLRLLHNFLTSVFSLVEHTYVFRKDLNNTELNLFYDEKLKELKINEKNIFLKDLRIYTQHYKLPFCVARLSFQAIDSLKGYAIAEQKLELSKEQLLNWDKWSSLSKSFLKIQDKHIDLKRIIEEHNKLINEFYKIFYDKIAKLYTKEIM